nr:transposase [Planktothrix sp. FACHB-1355]
MSNVLWSHIKTDSSDLASICLLGYVPNTLAKSWYSTKLNYLPNENWLKTSLQSSTASQQDCTDSESTSLKSLKIRLYPDQTLHQTWKIWLAASRYCYNQAIEYQRKNGSIGKFDLRKIILAYVPEWVSQTPYSFRVQAVYDAKEAYDKSRKKGTKQHEAGRFRSIRDRIKSIRFRQEDYKNGTWFPSLTKDLSFKSAEPLPAKDVEYQVKQKDGSYIIRCRKQSWESETQLVYDKKRWFAIFPVEFIPELSDSQKIIALDPGVRTFMTGFDGAKFVEIGNNDIRRIYRLCNHVDKLISRKSKLKGRRNKHQRQKLQRKIDRIFNRVRNLVDEVHRKTAAWLTTEYRLIFLPTFETSQMVAKNRNKKRKINTKTVRQMLGWAHYRFKQVLKFHALKRGCHVVDVTEEYTSKTCTKCGHVHPKLGGSKVFKCPHCGHKIPRDYNGALGIFLKALRDIAGLDGFTDSVSLCPTSTPDVRA